MFGGAKTVLVQAPALDAARARRRGAGRASWGTLCTLSSLLVRAVTGWARRFTGAYKLYSYFTYSIAIVNSQLQVKGRDEFKCTLLCPLGDAFTLAVTLAVGY